MNEIKELEQRLVHAKQSLTKRKGIVADNIRKKYPILFGIHASPNDTHHVSHNVSNCVFTTRENAQKYCIKGSYDMDDNVGWSYQVIALDPNEVSVNDLLHLDMNRNYDFPY